MHLVGEHASSSHMVSIGQLKDSRSRLSPVLDEYKALCH